jgi:hypothetical protein
VANDSRARDAPSDSPPVALLRSFTLADFVTLANASAGTAAIFACLLYVDVVSGAAMVSARLRIPKP